jgi:hypothetical protein
MIKNTWFKSRKLLFLGAALLELAVVVSSFTKHHRPAFRTSFIHATYTPAVRNLFPALGAYAHAATTHPALYLLVQPVPLLN